MVLRIKNIDTQQFSLTLTELDKPKTYSLGLTTVIALSSLITIKVNDLLRVMCLVGAQGNYTRTVSAAPEAENSVTIDFIPDKEIFKELELVYEQLNPFLQQFAYLNPELKLTSEDHSGKDVQRNVFHYPKGIFQQLDLYTSQMNFWNSYFRLDIEASVNGYHYRIGIHDPDPLMERHYSKTFAGNIEMYWGGSLEEGILQGLKMVVKELAQKEQVQIHLTKKAIKKHFAFMAAVEGKEFSYEGSTKRKLGVPLIKKDAAQIVYEHMMAYYQSEPAKASAVLRDFRVWEGDEDA